MTPTKRNAFPRPTTKTLSGAEMSSQAMLMCHLTSTGADLPLLSMRADPKKHQV